jgi:Secretion system C-terminal sorting domain
MKLFLLAAFATCANFAVAQNVSLYPTPDIYVSGSPVETIITAEAHVINTSANPINVTWVRENVNMPTGWKTSVCDLNSCWSSSLGTQEFLLPPTPAGTQGEIMHVQFKPFNVEGTGQVDVALYQAGGGPELARNTYHCTAALVGTTRVEQTTANVFPNPTTHYINISNNDNIAKATLTTAVGATVRTFTINGAAAQLDISDLSAGVYFLQLNSKDDTNLRNIRILKN